MILELFDSFNALNLGLITLNYVFEVFSFSFDKELFNLAAIILRFFIFAIKIHSKFATQMDGSS